MKILRADVTVLQQHPVSCQVPLSRESSCICVFFFISENKGCIPSKDNIFILAKNSNRLNFVVVCYLSCNFFLCRICYLSNALPFVSFLVSCLLHLSCLGARFVYLILYLHITSKRKCTVGVEISGTVAI